MYANQFVILRFNTLRKLGRVIIPVCTQIAMDKFLHDRNIDYTRTPIILSRKNQRIDLDGYIYRLEEV